MAVTQKVTLYNNKFTVPPVINAVQNDTDRQVEAYFGDFTLQVGMTGKLSFIRSDGTHYEVSATLSTANNTATAELDQALTQAGVTQAQLKITDSGNVGSTFTFMIKVQPDVAGISVPQDGWSAQEFDQRLTDAENAIDAVEEDVEDLQEKEYDYAPVITDTASGSIATFPDGADGYPLKECVVDVDAVQDLHGYDHPWPAGGGKNKLPITASTKEVSGITYTVLKDSDNNVIGVRANGTATDNSYFYFIGGGAIALTLSNGNYKLNGCTGGSASTYSLIARIKPSTWVTNANGDTDIAVSDAGLDNIAIRIMSGTTVNNVVFYPMIRLATESDATFVPYSNECPITGWSSAKVTRAGKNLIDGSKKYQETTNTVVIGAVDSESAFHFFKAGTYTISFKRTNGMAFGVFMYDQNTTIQTALIGSSSTATNATFTLNKDSYIKLWIYKSGGIAPTDISDIQIEVGSTASDYEAFNGQTVTIDLDGTRYGGTIDVTRGKLRVDRAIITVSSDNWSYYAPSSGIPYLYSNVLDKIEPAVGDTEHPLVCSMLPYGGVEQYVSQLTDMACWQVSNHNIYLVDSSCTDKATYIAKYGGAQVVYFLATPIEVDLTPTEITTLLGINNIWADCGDIEVEYCADTRKFIEKMLA